MTRSPRHKKTDAAGFTLVEVMVALFVLSIGLLGIAKLSLSSMQANSSSYLRSQSSALVQQIIDNMHANRTEAIAGTYNINIGQAAPNPGVDCAVSVCTSTSTIAAYDLYMWKQRLSNLFPNGALPNGDGQITTVTSNINGESETLVTVQVQWDDSVAQWAFGTPTTVAPAAQSIIVETLL